VIHLGDYIDRGPESAGVIEHLIDFTQDGDAVCLAGNHDLYLRDFLIDPDRVGEVWLRYGGEQALASWGIDVTGSALRNRPMRALHEAFSSALPPAHRGFFSRLPLFEQHGDYLFVHAGIRPGIPLHKQREADLTTIRDPFLSHEGGHGFVVVHGHTVVASPCVRPNRIGIDTKAYASGVLTCAVLEADTKGLLLPGGFRPLPQPEA
jgi:serine/threonine protein phosphatase 1